MWLFDKKKSLLDTGVMNGWTDRHSHILPGVDDGIQTMHDALSVLGFYEEVGVSDVWLTPHIMEDCPNTIDKLQSRFAELLEAYSKSSEMTDDGLDGQTPRCKGSLNLHLAAENMIDTLFVHRMEKGELLPYGDDGKELLVETSYVQPPHRFKEILQEVRMNGYSPVLAHPERYRYMDYDDYDELHDMGVRFQMNLSSLAGAYGPLPKSRAEYLLQYDYYKYQGSDVHSLMSLKKYLSEKTLKKKVVSLISEKIKK